MGMRARAARMRRGFYGEALLGASARGCVKRESRTALHCTAPTNIAGTVAPASPPTAPLLCVVGLLASRCMCCRVSRAPHMIWLSNMLGGESGMEAGTCVQQGTAHDSHSSRAHCAQ